MNASQAMEKHQNTKETTPWHIFSHEVHVLAIKLGADAERVHTLMPKALFWYRAGESLGMVAVGLRDSAKGQERAEREDQDGLSVIRAAREQAKVIS